ncbi:MAG: hypothetical protein PSV13_16315 [Lacunisphaera sp.]|nr:hypothetical protein [Lacunisphaera sp.]
MKTITPRVLLAPLALLVATALPAAEAIPLQPFVIDHHARQDSPADVSFLLGKAPAGQDGFVTIKDGHLVKADGSRFRIWGVNLTGWARGSTNLPPKDQAELWAKALARIGVNCVRFHFLDLPTRDPQEAADEQKRRASEAAGQRFKVRPAGLVDHRFDDTQHLDAEALDRLDWFVYQLKQHGIYSNLNLNVGLRYKAGDQVPDADLITLSKGFTYIGERMLELQKLYAKLLLTHHNPYTQTDYRHEPAVATVEIVNENSILEFWMRNWLRGELTPGSERIQLDFTPFYATQLDGMYQAWLTKHRTPEQVARIRELAGVKPGAPVPRLRRGDFSTAPKEQFHAEAEFLTDIEKDFFTGMGDYLKKELGVKSLVIGNADHTYWIPNQPMMRANRLLDFVDGHVYWQHPAIWGKRNTPMVDEPLRSTIVKLARTPFVGRPFTVSEVNHPNPNEYTAEMIPLLAAYAAFQDWDGIYFYTFEPKVGPEYQHYVADEFDITLDPVKIPQMSVGALLFSRADVAPAKQTVARSYSAEQVNEAMRLPESERPYFTPGFPRSLPLRHGSRISSVEGAPTGKFEPEPPLPYVSDTGELAWHNEPGKRGLVTIDTPRSQALVGFIRTNSEKTTKHLSAEIKNDFAAITLSSLTDEPIRRSDRLLLTATSRWENSGAVWNERRSLQTNLGHEPTLIEPVTGWLVLRELDGAVALKLTPLDGAAKPIGEPILGRRLEDGWEIPLGTPATAHYLIEIVR